MIHPVIILMYTGWLITAATCINIGLDAFGYRLIDFSRPLKIVIGLTGLLSFFMWFVVLFGPEIRVKLGYVPQKPIVDMSHSAY